MLELENEEVTAKVATFAKAAEEALKAYEADVALHEKGFAKAMILRRVY